MSASNKGAGVDTRLQSVTNALFLNQVDDVVMRTHVDGITLQGNVIVDAVRLWDGVDVLEFEPPNNDNEPGQVALPSESYNMVFNQSTGLWDRLRGSAASGAWVTVKNDRISISKDTNPNSDTNRIFVNTTGTVSLSQNSLDALETITVNQGSSWTVDIGNNGLVGLNTGSNTIGNVKIVDANGNQNDNTHPLYITGTVNLASNTELEIKNDLNNPIPVSRNTSTNTMTNPIYVQYGIDTNLNNFTSKNRLKVSGYQINFSHTYQFSSSADFWDESITNNGTATSVWDPNQSAMRMTVNTTQGAKIVRQTRQVMPYVPGRAAQFSMAHQWQAPVAGCRARIGIFDENNGMYFEDSGTDYFCVIRSKVSGAIVETRKSRSQWNGDKFDGNGPSGLTALPGAIQLICIDYEWYGAGQVIFSYVMNGIKYAIHTFDNANVESDVWCSTPFLPIRVELENVSGSVSSKQICIASSSWALEGDQVLGGVPLVIGHSRHNLQVKDTFYATISVRLKSTCLNAVNILKRFQLASETANVVFKWKMIVNPTLTGAVWTDHPIPNSTMQYDISATGFTGGWVVNEGIAYNNADQFDFDPLGNAFQMARNSLQTGLQPDIITLAISSTTQNVYIDTFLRWREMR